MSLSNLQFFLLLCSIAILIVDLLEHRFVSGMAGFISGLSLPSFFSCFHFFDNQDMPAASGAVAAAAVADKMLGPKEDRRLAIVLVNILFNVQILSFPLMHGPL